MPWVLTVQGEKKKKKGRRKKEKKKEFLILTLLVWDVKLDSVKILSRKPKELYLRNYT